MEGKAEDCPVGESGPEPGLAQMLCRAEGLSMNFTCLQLQPTEISNGETLNDFKDLTSELFFCPLRWRLLGVAKTSSPIKYAATPHWATGFGNP